MKEPMTEEFASALASIKIAAGYNSTAWGRVRLEARKYAQMKLTGTYMENGNRCTVSFSDRARYAEMFKENMLRFVEDAFLEDALLGQTIMDNTLA